MQEAIKYGSIQDYGKLKLPKKVQISEVTTHPIDPRVLAISSDGYIRICSDGQKFLATTSKGKVLVWDGRTIGSKNILLAQIKLNERGIISACSFSYNGDKNADSILTYSQEGNIQILKLKLSKSLKKIREIFRSSEEQTNSYGKLIEQGPIFHTQNEVLSITNLSCQQLIQSHQYNNVMGFSIIKSRQSSDGSYQESCQLKLIQLKDKLYPQQQFPIISEQYSHSYKELIPDEEGRVFFQSQIFFIEKEEIKSFSAAQGLLSTVVNLKQPLQCDKLTFLNLQFRPLQFKFQDTGRFLVNYMQDGNVRTCIVKTKIIGGQQNQIENFKEIACSHSFFLGKQGLKNPPVFIITENQQNVQIYIDSESDLDPEISEIMKNRSTQQILLLQKVQKAYYTPLREGFGFWFGPVLLYCTQTHIHYLTIQGDRQVLSSHDDINAKQLIGMTMIDRIIMLEKMNNKFNINIKIRGFSFLEPLILGYLSIQAYLQKKPQEKYIKSIIECYKSNRISHNLIQRLSDFGFQQYALFLITKDDCRQFTAFQKINLSKKLGLQTNFLEFVFPGKNLQDQADYNDIVQKLAFDPRYAAKKKILQNLEHYFLNIGSYHNAIQTSAFLGNYDKIILLCRLLGEKEIEKQVVEQIFQVSGGFQYHETIQYPFIANNVEIIEDNKNKWIEKFPPFKNVYLKNLQPIQENILENLSLLELLKENFPCKKIEQIENYLKKMQILTENEFKIRETAFGEDIYYQAFYDQPLDDDEDEVQDNIQKVNKLAQENVQQYIGLYSEYREVNMKQGGGQHNENQNEQNDQPMFDDDEDEYKDLLVYWRFDQGKGEQVEDISNYQNLAVIKLNEQEKISVDQIWVKNEEGKPMELEDNWGGKKCPIQYSIDCSKGMVQSQKKIRQFKQKIKEFTAEIWVKPNENLQKAGSIFSIQKDSCGTFEVKINQNFQIEVFLQGQKIQLVHLAGENEEKSEHLAFVGGQWGHLCVQYDQESQKFIIYQNCKKQFQSVKIALQENLFKDKMIQIGDGFEGMITEFRFQKVKLALSEIKESYKTPLAIVSEKLKEIKVRFKDKDKNMDLKQISVNKFDFGNIIGAGTSLQNNEQKNEDKQQTQMNQFKFGLPGQNQEEEQNKNDNIDLKSQNNQDSNKNKASNFNMFKFQPPEDGGTKTQNNKNSDSESEQEKEEKKKEKEQTQQQDINNQLKQQPVNQSQKPFFAGGNFGAFVFQPPEEVIHGKQENISNYNEEASEHVENNQFQNFQNLKEKKEHKFDIDKTEDTDQIKLEKQKQENKNNSDFDNFAVNESKNKQENGFNDFGSVFGEFDKRNQEKIEKNEKQSKQENNAAFSNFGEGWGEQNDDSIQKIQNNQQNNQNNQWEGFGDMQNKNSTQNTNTFSEWGAIVNQNKTNVNTNKTNEQQKEFNNNEFSSFNNNFTEEKNIKKSFDQIKENTFEQFNQNGEKSVNSNQLQENIQNHANQLENENSHSHRKWSELFQKSQSEDKKQNNVQSNNQKNSGFQRQQSLPQDFQEQFQQEQGQLQSIQQKNLQLNSQSINIIQSNFFNTSHTNVTNSNDNQSPNLNQIQQIQQQKQIQQDSPNTAFKLKSQQDYKQMQGNQLIKTCGVYRFALQMLVQIEELNKDNSLLTKEIFMYCLLIQLNLNPQHKFVIKFIERNIEVGNFLLAEGLLETLKGLIENNKNIKIKEEYMQKLNECEKIINSDKNTKQNKKLEKVLCPYCYKTFHFKGNKQCNKCDKQFEIGYKTLDLIQKANTIKCNICAATFKQDQQQIQEKECILCKFGKLQQIKA
ncbi:WD40-repeat-containing domain [Pseudocohnilembus persalinus]|uniref:WD40-repeat-containing domain n=1 Tax=Pseudocohnilembus persalinus TaxID=266149 RepID=A0A0V0QGW8_PSEPJ|nr:WD40-repeat-containing domain [Pseudocohnilembus persalinus]|eukprot:KRX01360.1 WD40-repeat-containing domain [Pseudocohnilembus persalinus]